MNGRYLLDTNIVIAFFNGDSEVATRIESTPEIFLSSTALGELFYGAANSGRPEENAARVRRFAATCGVLEVSAETSELYGTIKGRLRKLGRPIPENDLWIAAAAIQHRLVLVSRDRHFEMIPDLEIEHW